MQDNNNDTPNIPHSIDAERSLIGSVFINPSVFYEVDVKPSAFYIHSLRWIWEAFQKVVETNKEIDILTVGHALGNKLQEIGGSAYFTQIVMNTPSSLGADSYAKIVNDMAMRRSGIFTANKIAQGAYNLEAEFSPEDFSLEIIADGGSGRKSAKQASSDAIELVMKSGGLTTGVSAIDNLIGGMFPHEVSVVAGRPGAGKSAWMKQAATANADNGKKVLLISSEESAGQIWLKLACGHLGINPSMLRGEGIAQSALTDVFKLSADLGEKYDGKIVIYENEMTPTQIYAAALREQPNIVYIDTMRNITGKQRGQSVSEFYDYAVRYIRAKVAKNENNPAHVCFLSHLGREVEKQDRRPTKADLMYAGESFADNVHLFHRNQAVEGVSRVSLDWIYAKGRFGAIGTKELGFDLPKQQFFDSL